MARSPLWATLAVCAAILAYRRLDLVRSPQFWAEDGLVFYAQAHIAGWSTLMAPYAGYLHTIPRLVAVIARGLDPVLAPASFLAAAFALTLYVAARTQSPRCPLPRHPGFALAVVLVPDAFEVLLFIVNVQWILAGAFVLLLISRDARRIPEHVHDIAAGLLLGLTGPFSILFAPLFVWRAWRRRTRASGIVALTVILSAAVQAWTIWTHPIVMNGEHIALEALLAVAGMRMGASLLAGSLAPPTIPLLVGTIAGAITLLGLTWLGCRRSGAAPERRWLALAAAAVLASSLYRCRYVLPELTHAGYGARYFFPLQLIVMWLLLSAAWDRRRWVARAAVLACVWIVAANAARLREPGLPDFDWAGHARKIRRGEAVTVPINPADWTFTLPGGPSQPEPSGLVNVSARCWVTPERPAIVGFVVHAGPCRKLLLRASGPALFALGIPDGAMRPVLRLLNGAGEDHAFEPPLDPAKAAAIAATAERLGAFRVQPGTAEPAGIVELAPGSYSVIVSAAGGSGEVLLEIFEVPPAPEGIDSCPVPLVAAKPR